MVADEQKKRLVADKRLRAMDGVAVAQRRALLDELKPGRVAAGRRRVGRLVTRPDDHADLFDARQQNLFDERRQGRLLNAIAINQSLERQRALAFSSGGNDCFSYFHSRGELLFLVTTPKIFGPGNIYVPTTLLLQVWIPDGVRYDGIN